jgi:hypothetical protein
LAQARWCVVNKESMDQAAELQRCQDLLRSLLRRYALLKSGVDPQDVYQRLLETYAIQEKFCPLCGALR